MTGGPVGPFHAPTLQTDSEVYAGLEVVPQGPTAGNGPTQDFSANGLNP